MLRVIGQGVIVEAQQAKPNRRDIDEDKVNRVTVQAGECFAPEMRNNDVILLAQSGAHLFFQEAISNQKQYGIAFQLLTPSESREF